MKLELNDKEKINNRRDDNKQIVSRMLKDIPKKYTFDNNNKQTKSESEYE